MKKLLFTLLLAAAGLSGWAEDLYIVGNVTTLDAYVYGDGRAPWKLEETGSGTNIYKWTGYLKKGDFKICTGLSTWDAYHPKSENQSENFEISEVAQEITTDGTNDRKWLVVNPGFFEVTVDLSQATKTATFVPQWTDINTADELITFAETVNAATEGNQNNAKWARLTADIDMDGKTFPGIGRDSKWVRYVGTFDGQGHVISNLNMTSEHCAFVTVAGGGCTVKNLLIDSSCEFNGNGRNAALISCCNYTDFGTPLTIESCGNEANVTGTSNNCAGLLGCNYGNGVKVTIKNSFNAGNISSTGSESAPISGWLGSNARVENTYNIGYIEDARSNNSFARWDGSGSSYENCYSTLGWGTAITGKTLGYDIDNVSSGLFCYTLNGNTSGGEAWKQNLPSDTGDSHPYPGVFAGHAKVFANGDTYCDGSSKGSVTYTNTAGENRDPHNFVNGFCSNCNELDVSYLTPVSGYYEIDDMNKLHWFSQYVIAGNPTVNAKLTADVAMESDNQYGYTPIGTASHPYTGHFDGQGHSVTLKINNPSYSYQGLFGIVTDGAFIEKVIVKGYVTGSAYVGGIVGGTNGGSSNAKETKIWYCGNEATITSNGANGGGIIGVNMSGSASVVLLNCYNTGNITSGSDGGALSGWLGGGWSNVRNCYNSGTVKNGGNTSKAFGRNNGCYFTNCYYTEESGTDNSTEDTDHGTPAMVTDAALASGALCYKLNGDQSEIAFRQLLGTDTYPTTDFNNNKPQVYELAVSDAEYASFVPTVNIQALPTGVKAYVGQIQNNGSSLHLEEVTALPANNAFVVNAAKGNYYYNNTSASITLSVANDLTYSDEAIVSDGTQYCLANKTSGVGFYKVQSGITIPARKAYLAVTAGIKEFYGFEDDATGISLMEDGRSQMEDGAIYNLAGQRINKMQRGINIVNGKKILK